MPAELMFGQKPIMPMERTISSRATMDWRDEMSQEELLAARIRQLERRPEDVEQSPVRPNAPTPTKEDRRRRLGASLRQQPRQPAPSNTEVCKAVVRALRGNERQRQWDVSPGGTRRNEDGDTGSREADQSVQRHAGEPDLRGMDSDDEQSEAEDEPMDEEPELGPVFSNQNPILAHTGGCAVRWGRMS